VDGVDDRAPATLEAGMTRRPSAGSGPLRPLPGPAADVLAGGVLCHLAVATSSGPHVTPVVYAVHASRLWVTTARRSVKVRAWRRDPRVSGLVREGSLALSFLGRVASYDLLDPATWLPSALAAPTLTLAAARFTARNARFFAGYAVDARRVPLAWTPPGRVFAGIDLEAAAVLDTASGRVVHSWGWPAGTGRELPSRSTFPRAARRASPLAAVPSGVRERVGEAGAGTASTMAPGGWPVVLPARWAADEGLAVAAMPRSFLELAAPDGPTVSAALTVDRASAWRARAMTGVLLRGEAGVVVPRSLRSGIRAAAAWIGRTGAAVDLDEAVLLALRPRSAVWWRGWASGTVAAP
jgi:hypothetical protein